MHEEFEFEKQDLKIKQTMSILRARVVLVGDAAVGKTCIAHQLVSGNFNKNYAMTQACEYTVKEMKIEGTNTMVELHLLDIGGQRIFEEITGELLAHANMCVVVYDSTNPETVGNVKAWYERVCHANDKQVPGIVIGNKADLDNRISVSPEDGREIAA